VPSGKAGLYSLLINYIIRDVLMGKPEADFQQAITTMQRAVDIRGLAELYLLAQSPVHQTLIERAFIEATVHHAPHSGGDMPGSDEPDDLDLRHLIARPGLTPAIYRAAMDRYAVFMPNTSFYFFLKLAGREVMPEPVRDHAEAAAVLAAQQRDCSFDYLKGDLILSQSMYSVFMGRLAVSSSNFTRLLEVYDQQDNSERKSLALSSLETALRKLTKLMPGMVLDVYLRTDLGEKIHLLSERALVQSIRETMQEFRAISCVFREWDKLSEPVKAAAVRRTEGFITEYSKKGNVHFGLSYVLECANVPDYLKAKAQRAKDRLQARAKRAEELAARPKFNPFVYLEGLPAGKGTPRRAGKITG
jgi:hypothetical protein